MLGFMRSVRTSDIQTCFQRRHLRTKTPTHGSPLMQFGIVIFQWSRTICMQKHIQPLNTDHYGALV